VIQKQESHPSTIELELRHILDAMQGTNTMRACLLNLIIYTKDSPRRSYFEKVAQKIIEKFPSRIIFLSEYEKKDGLHTYVSVLTAKSGDNLIFCDLITIEFGESFAKRVPFIILPYILPDLPLYILWGEDPIYKNPNWLQLEKFIYKLIFDSEVIKQLPRFATSMANYLQICSYKIADLNWARIEEWRKLLAVSFHTADKIEGLQQTKCMKITYNCTESALFSHTKIQALYLQSWLASRMHWDFQSIVMNKKNLIISYSNQNSSIEVILQPTMLTTIQPGGIFSLEIDTVNNLHFLFKRSAKNPLHISIDFSNPNFCEIPTYYLFSSEESGQSLVQEIFHRGPNIHFFQALQIVKQIQDLVCK